MTGDELVAAVDKRILQYVQILDKLKAMDAEYEERRKPLVEMRNILSEWVIGFFEATGTSSVKTKHGTCYSSTRYAASLTDPDAFMKFVIENGLFELMDGRANVTAVKDYVKEKGVLPPGCNLNALKSVGVRRREDQETEGPAPLSGSVNARAQVQAPPAPAPAPAAPVPAPTPAIIEAQAESSLIAVAGQGRSSSTGSVAAGGPNAHGAALGQTAEDVGDPTDAGSALDERIKYLLATV